MIDLCRDFGEYESLVTFVSLKFFTFLQYEKTMIRSVETWFFYFLFWQLK